ncbi:MAG: NAD(P)(+) transhydrogenase (Re/Si-specific) subunit beta, partial [Planctomycetota bacterium]
MADATAKEQRARETVRLRVFFNRVWRLPSVEHERTTARFTDGKPRWTTKMALAIDTSQLADAAYLAAAVLFILGLKGMTHPRTAVRGNALGALGMLVAVLATVVRLELLSVGLVATAMVVGAFVGLVLAVRVQLTEMPELVALFNGLGGAASLLVAGAEVTRQSALGAAAAGEAAALSASPPLGGAAFYTAAGVAGLIGAVTLTGSLIAGGKLQGLSLVARQPPAW